MSFRFVTLLLLVIVIIIISVARSDQTATAQDSTGTTIRISVGPGGTEANEYSARPAISADGRYIVFESLASNLVSGDTNQVIDIFVYDQLTRQTSRVSVASNGVQANGGSNFGNISPDGRYVAFTSLATNLVPGDTNATRDLFLHDRQTGQTSRLSVASDGTEGNGTTSSRPAVSEGARFIAFQSDASNLVPGDNNRTTDVFLHDRATGQISLVSTNSQGEQGNTTSLSPVISADGRFVAFRSFSTNLVPNDRNAEFDIFLKDTQTGETSRISVASDGTEANENSLAPAIAYYGQHITFESDASNLVPGDTNGQRDVFLHDRQTGQTERVDIAFNGAQAYYQSLRRASVSAIGWSVAFQSRANNLIPGDTNGWDDIFIRHRLIGQTVRVSISTDGTQPRSASSSPAMSANGRYVAFVSSADNLVFGDENGKDDIFLHDLGQAEPTATPTPTNTATPVSTNTPTPTNTPTVTPTPTQTPTPVVKIIPYEGGVLKSDTGSPPGVTVYFPPQAVMTDTIVTYLYQLPPLVNPLTDIDRSFYLTALYETDTVTLATQPMTIVVHYSDRERGGSIPETLYLYRLDGSMWITDDITFIDRDENTLTSTARLFTIYAVLGETNRIYLPLIIRRR